METISDTLQVQGTELASANAQYGTTAAVRIPKQRHFGRIVRTAVALASLGSALGIASLASTGAAGAATTPVISQTPTFECGIGTITIDKPMLYQNGQSVTWESEIMEYTSTGWKDAYTSPQTTTATVFGELVYSPVQLTAPHNTYFEIYDWFYTTATGWVYAQARAETGGAPINSYLCRTS